MGAHEAAQRDNSGVEVMIPPDKRGYRTGAEADWRDARIEELQAKVARMEGIIGGQWQELDFSRVPCEGSTRMPR